MSNMSYCRFENTYNDLRDCTSVMEEACDLKELDLSKSEQLHMKLMRDLAERFMEEYDRLMETADAFQE